MCWVICPLQFLPLPRSVPCKFYVFFALVNGKQPSIVLSNAKQLNIVFCNGKQSSIVFCNGKQSSIVFCSGKQPLCIFSNGKQQDLVFCNDKQADIVFCSRKQASIFSSNLNFLEINWSLYILFMFLKFVLLSSQQWLAFTYVEWELF